MLFGASNLGEGGLPSSNLCRFLCGAPALGNINIITRTVASCLFKNNPPCSTKQKPNHCLWFGGFHMSAVVKIEIPSYIRQGLLPFINCKINSLHSRRVPFAAGGPFTPKLVGKLLTNAF